MVIGGDKRKEKIKIYAGDEQRTVDTTKDPKTIGINVSVHLDQLIDKIHIEPYADDWFANTVKKL